ncbi:hypothetical protein GSF04_20910 [Pseudoalteromonas sp. A22]|uniref:hypothetical protein n=1 Tax=Pseudoalteromonas TaxID=53246 RepID=UPI001BAE2ACF|nr:hypothetical protein [Pseudoalteromonas sp. A22]QUI64801.1 hypothetical protein GSF04_20910 [Pseudoalteromonas sp. A22]
MKLNIILGVILLLIGCGKSEPAKPDKYGAYFTCQDGVKRKLKTPSTASFSSISESNVTQLRIGRRGGKDEIQFLVVGYVDAQNSFGAKLRNNFTCKATGQTGDLWRIDSLYIQ